MKLTYWISFASAFLACTMVMGVAGGSIALMSEGPVPERFATSAFSFDLPPGWSCAYSAGTYVCSAGKPPWSALVVIALKMRNASDNPAAYEAKIREMPNDPDRKGTRLVSLRRRLILGSPWVEGTLIGSEVANYQTIYLAGTTSEVGILITLSVHKDAFSKRMRDIQAMMDTLVVNQHAVQ